MPGIVQALGEDGLVKFRILLGETVTLVLVYVAFRDRLRVLSGVPFVSRSLALVFSDLISNVFLLQSDRVGPAISLG